MRRRRGAGVRVGTGDLYQLVQLMQGQIWLESEEGKGSCSIYGTDGLCR